MDRNAGSHTMRPALEAGVRALFRSSGAIDEGRFQPATTHTHYLTGSQVRLMPGLELKSASLVDIARYHRGRGNFVPKSPSKVRLYNNIIWMGDPERPGF